MGAAIGMDEYGRANEKALFAHEFNSFTPNNNMKWNSIEKQPNVFSWANIDTLVNFAISKTMVIRGHCLVWRDPSALPKYTNQLFGWVTHDEISPGVYKMVTRQKFFSQLKNHITTTMQHFGTKVYAYDVVNEAIAEDAQADTNMYKTWRTDMYQVCKQGGNQGSDYIDSAFKYAQQANPSAALFYNDYGLEEKPKRDRVINLITRLKASGRKVSGIGIQAHWYADYPTKQQVLDMLAAFKAKGLIIHITELDVSMYNKGETPTSNITYTQARKDAQTAKYRELFDAFRTYNNEISSVTFWNLTDRKHGRSTTTQPDYLLLFDASGAQKPVYGSVIADIP
jgi:endo-1,4-beta-xylanase